MTASVDEQTDQHYVDFDEYIEFQLGKARSSIKLTDLLTAGAGVVVLVIVYLLVFTVLDHWVVEGGFSGWSRGLAFSGLLLATLVWTGWTLVRPLSRKVTGLFAARELERSSPGLKSSLLNLADLDRSGRSIREGIRASMERRAAVALSQMDVDQAIDRRKLMQVSYTLLGVVVLLCLYVLFSPKAVSFARPLWPSSTASVATETEIVEVTPGDTDVLARSQLEVAADLRGETPEHVRLLYTTDDRKYVDEPIEMRPADDGIQRYRAMITGRNGGGLLQDFTYRVHAGDAVTRDFRVHVIQPPFTTIEQIRYEYPPYMNLPSKTQPDGHIDAWVGTKVTLTAMTNMPVVSGLVVFSDDEESWHKVEEIPVEVIGGTKLRAEWTLEFRDDGSYPHAYHLDCRNEEGERNPDPALYSVTIRPDQPPEVVLLDPVRDLTMPANGIVPLFVQAKDPDFLLRSVALKIGKQGEELPLSIPLLEQPRRELRRPYQWNLEPLQLQPGDEIAFWIEARDNRQPLGNRKNTPKLNIRIVDAVPEEKVQEQLQADSKDQQERLEEQHNDGEEEDTVPDDSNPADRSNDDRGKADQSSEESGSGQKQQAPPEDQDANPQEGANSDESSDESSTSENHSGESDKRPIKNDGSDDQELLRRMHERFAQDEDQGEDNGGTPSPEQSAEPDQPPRDKESPEKTTEEPQQPTEQQKPGDSAGGDNQDETDPAGQQRGDSQGDRGDQPSERSEKGGNQQDSDGENSAQSDAADGDRGGGKGTPGNADSQNNQSGDGEGSKPSPSKTGEAAKESDEQIEGEEQPSDRSEGARREKATGQEQGEGRPDHDPNADPTRAKNKVTRKPGEPPATRPHDGTAEPMPDQNNPNKQDGRDDTRNNRRDGDPTGQTKPENQSEPATRQSQEKKTGSRPTDSQQPGDRNDPGSNQQQAPGGGASQQPGSGSPGSGQGGAEAAGSQSDSAADSQSESATGSQSESSETNGNGAGESGSQDSSSTQSGASDSGQSGSGGKGKQPGEPGSGSGPGKGLSSPEKMPADGNSRGGVSNQQGGDGTSGSGNAQAAEAANLEFGKKAANLVLKRLDRQLERGDVDRKLLDELGWTKGDVKKFADRLRDQLDSRRKDDSPTSQARSRQFNEMLKSLNIRRAPQGRRGSTTSRRSHEGVGPRRLSVPPEYQDALDAYTRELSKRANASRGE